MAVRRYKAPQTAFTIVGSHIETDGKFGKKMSGSTLAGIFGLSPFNTPFQQACNLMGICREDLDGKPAIEIGKALEGRIIEYLGERYPEKGLFVPANAMFGDQEGDHDQWRSDFDDPWFAGRMDGMVFDGDDMDLDRPDGYILEIKTTSNYESWENGVPDYYAIQVELYNHFLPHPKKKAYVAVCLVDDATRKDTSSWKGSDDNVFLFELKISETKVKKKLAEAIEWYKKHVVAGRTPDFDIANKGDRDMWEHLVNITTPKGSVQSDIDRLEDLEAEIAEREEAMKDLTAERETLRARIKDYMTTNKLVVMATTSHKYVAQISESKRKTIDTKLMEKDGIDPAKYTVTKVVQTFTLKPLKEENNEEGEENEA